MEASGWIRMVVENQVYPFSRLLFSECPNSCPKVLRVLKKGNGKSQPAKKTSTKPVKPTETRLL